jgi:hypothetical protein
LNDGASFTFEEENLKDHFEIKIFKFEKSIYSSHISSVDPNFFKQTVHIILELNSEPTRFFFYYFFFFKFLLKKKKLVFWI